MKTRATVKSHSNGKTFDVYIGRVHNEENIDTVRTMLDDMRSQHKLEHSNLTELARIHNKLQSFKFEIPYAQRTLIFDSDIWPEGIVLSKFNQPRLTLKPDGQKQNQEYEATEMDQMQND